MFPIRDNIRSRTFPFVNYLIILANLLMFCRELQLVHLRAIEPFMIHYSLIPARFFSDPFAHWPEVFSAMFLHGGWAHVIGNMWFLFIFGDSVEDNMGHVRYFFFYLLCGFGAAAAQLFAGPRSAVPMLGASGAIAGVLGAYCLLYPTAQVTTLFVFFIFIRFIDIPALFYLGLWFLVQAMNGMGSLAAHQNAGGIAWWAHAGGFVTGFLLVILFAKRRRRPLPD